MCKKEPNTFNVIPSWESIFPVLIEIAASTRSGKKDAMDSLLGVARCIDQIKAGEHPQVVFNCFPCSEESYKKGLYHSNQSVSSLVSAAMHKADISNLRTLVTAFPIIWLQTWIAFNKGWSDTMMTEENVLEAIEFLAGMQIVFPLDHLLQTGQLSYNTPE